MIVAHLVAGLVSMILPKQLSFTALPPVWSCITFHESTDNPAAINVQNGDSGAFQFAKSTWQEFAPEGFPLLPTAANLLQQYEVSQIVYKAQGARAWETANLCGLS